jgi:transcriptional regulator with GAF, ATPase, and Fis domain
MATLDPIGSSEKFQAVLDPLELQQKLPRVLQEKQFERPGDGSTLQADVRIIAATKQDLWRMV